MYRSVVYELGLQSGHLSGVFSLLLCQLGKLSVFLPAARALIKRGIKTKTKAKNMAKVETSSQDSFIQACSGMARARPEP